MSLDVTFAESSLALEVLAGSRVATWPDGFRASGLVPIRPTAGHFHPCPVAPQWAAGTPAMKVELMGPNGRCEAPP